MAWVEKSAKNAWRVRFRRDDGDGIGSINGFSSAAAAREYAESMETDQRRGTFIDPDGGKTTLGEWSEDWLAALDVAQATEDYYRSLLTSHVLPRWGETALADISGIKVAAWAKGLRSRYAVSTVSGIVKLLTLLLSDAVDERLIAANPVRPKRRGRRSHTRTSERVWVNPEQALALADGAAELPGAGPMAAVLIVTAAWTGARWGELTGLQRPNLHLHLPDEVAVSRIVVDPDIGALHETSRGLSLGPPKTAESARAIELPPFLVRLLAAHVSEHLHLAVFPTPDGGWHRRSNFARRAFRPAAHGNAEQPRPAVVLPAVRPGLTFHGLRHSHKTWMIADQIPEIAQAQRLGHILDDKITQTYSHVADEVRHRLLRALQDRWEKAVAERGIVPDWRASATDSGSL